MVEVIGLSQREIKEKQRQSELVRIAWEVFPECDLLETQTSFSVISRLDNNRRFYVYPYADFDLFSVPNPGVLDSAVKLAEAYERAGLGNFTVKKDYIESKSAGKHGSV